MEAEKYQTKVALIWSEGKFHISFNTFKRSREILRNEDERYNSYELFINNHSPADMMKAVDGFAADDFDMMRLEGAPAYPFTSSAAKDLAGLYSENPTRTDVKNAQDLIRKWGAESNADYDFTNPTVDFPSLIKAARDLNAACKLLLYSLGECPEKFVQKFLPDLPRLRREGSGDLVGAYYERLMRAAAAQLGREINSIEGFFKGKEAVGYHAVAMFNILLSGASPQINLANTSKVTLFNSSNDALVVIWTYFAEMMQKNKATVCANCGDIFIRKRKTGKYCSRSCASMASKNK